MKYTKPLRILLITWLAIFAFCDYSVAQNNTDNKNDAKKHAFKNMVDSQHFVFVANSVNPTGGRFRNLTSSYDVTFLHDTLVSYLPYFGRAFSAPLNPTESVLDFTSRDFTYTVSPRKKEGWNVLVKLKDNHEVQQFLFTIFDNGSASLSVTLTSRDPISFNGTVKKQERKKKKK
ncbi:MAG: DUF4251 domain-containing protein [Ginsengibacter sp.]